MNILITGGMGYIGTVLVEESVKAGYKTYVLTRNKEKAQALKRQSVYVIDPQRMQRLIFVGGTSYFGDSGDTTPKLESFRDDPKCGDCISHLQLIMQKKKSVKDIPLQSCTPHRFTDLPHGWNNYFKNHYLRINQLRL